MYEIWPVHAFWEPYQWVVCAIGLAVSAGELIFCVVSGVLAREKMKMCYPEHSANSQCINRASLDSFQPWFGNVDYLRCPLVLSTRIAQFLCAKVIAKLSPDPNLLWNHISRCYVSSTSFVILPQKQFVLAFGKILQWVVITSM